MPSSSVLPVAAVSLLIFITVGFLALGEYGAPLFWGSIIACGGAALLFFRRYVRTEIHPLLFAGAPLLVIGIAALFGLFSGVYAPVEGISIFSPYSVVTLVALFGFVMAGIALARAESRGWGVLILLAFIVALYAGGFATAALFISFSEHIALISAGLLSVAGLLLMGAGLDRTAPFLVPAVGSFALAAAFAVFSLAWFLGLIAGLFAALLSARAISVRRYGYAALIAGVCIVPFVLGAYLSPFAVTDTTPVPLTDALSIIGTHYSTSGAAPYIGGLAFENAWEAHRPFLINETPLWNGIVTSSGVHALDTLVQNGVIALVALFAAAAILTRRATQLLGTSPLRFSGAFIAAPAALWLLVFGPTSVIFLAAAFLLAGFLAASLYKTSEAQTPRFAALFPASVGVLVLLLGIGYGTEHALLSYAKSGNEAVALPALATVLPHDDTLRFLAERRQQDVLSALDSNAELSKVSEHAGAAQALARRAVALNPYDFKNHIVLGSTQAQLVVIGDTTLEQAAVNAFTRATELAPNHPIPHLLLGRLFVGMGEEGDARGALVEALRLRPGYPEAAELLERLGEAR